MGEKCFPDTQLKLMQKINNEHMWDVEITAKFINKSILRMKHKARINISRYLTYQCWDGGSCLEKAINGSTGNHHCRLVDCIPSDYNTIKQICMIFSKSKSIVMLCSSLVKLWFRNETPRGRANAFVSYGGKQSSVKRISSTVHEWKKSTYFSG